jgi:pimeloyl-ACP methyl ester carboxylesterase
MVLVGPTIDRWARTIPTQVARWVRSGLHERPSLPVVLARDALDAGARRIWGTFLDGLHDPVEEKLRAIEAPTLVVRGERDPIVPQHWAAEVARLLPRGRLVVVPRAGHALNYSRPHDLARLVRAFLSELDDPP